MEDCIFYIENAVDERRNAISGYFKTFDDAMAGIADCADWFRPKGTGSIYKVTFGLYPKRELVYENH